MSDPVMKQEIDRCYSQIRDLERKVFELEQMVLAIAAETDDLEYRSDYV